MISVGCADFYFSSVVSGFLPLKFTIVDLFEVQFGGAKEAIDGDSGGRVNIITKR